jgi:RNA polymerase sigma-70 factor, ECF subfamily
MMDFQAWRSDEKDTCCGDALGRESNPAQQNVDDDLHREIEALIPRLQRYARQLARDSVAADDLVQDCLARALDKIHLWEPGTDLRAWLFTILHNRHIGLARRDTRQRAWRQLQNSDSSRTLTPSQEARLELRDLERALAKLPEEQRSVILLIGLQGMGYEEAASVANLPIGTVRSRVSRGRKTLRMMTGLFPPLHSGSTAHARGARSKPRQAFYSPPKKSAWELVQ